MKEGVSYFIVAPASPDKEGLKYRRHRLVELLLLKPDTRHVYWIYPERERLGACIERRGDRLTVIGLPYSKGMFRFIGGLGNPMLHARLRPFIEQNPQRVLMYTYPYFYQLIDLCPWSKVVYDCSDYWCGTWVPKRGLRGLVQQFKGYMIRRTEERISSRAHLGFATSEYLAAHIQSMSQRSFLVIENGVEYELFAKAHPAQAVDVDRIQGVKLGFVGGLKAKIDYELLLEVSRQRPHWNVLLIGPVHGQLQELVELQSRPNIYLLGGKPPEAVPGYMKRLDIGLMPYKNIDYNRAVSPLKMFEYLAAQVPVVGCGLPTTQKYEEQGVYYYTDGTADQFIAACEQALGEKELELYRRKRLLRAQQQDWEKKLETMYRMI